MIVVLCANAGIDRTYEVENFALGHYHHPRHYRVAAGGKGINVARALRVFGVKAVVTGFVGGLAAQFIQRQLLEAGLQPAFVPIGEESRVCINIIDAHSRSQTQVDEVGPLVTPSEVDSLRRRWPRLLAKATLAIISGSVPRGVPLDLYAELITVAHETGKPVLLDARDDLLRRALPARPDLVKVNIHELERLAGRPLTFPAGVREALKAIVAAGVSTAIVTAGRTGSLGVSAAGQELWAEPPEVPNVGAVGAGDAYLAGVAAAMAAGGGLEDQMRWGTAAGAANAMTLGACLFGREHVQECLSGVKLASLVQPAREPLQPSEGQPGSAPQGGKDRAEQ